MVSEVSLHWKLNKISSHKKSVGENDDCKENWITHWYKSLRTVFILLVYSYICTLSGIPVVWWGKSRRTIQRLVWHRICSCLRGETWAHLLKKYHLKLKYRKQAPYTVTVLLMYLIFSTAYCAGHAFSMNSDLSCSCIFRFLSISQYFSVTHGLLRSIHV